MPKPLPMPFNFEVEWLLMRPSKVDHQVPVGVRVCVWSGRWSLVAALCAERCKLHFPNAFAMSDQKGPVLIWNTCCTRPPSALWICPPARGTSRNIRSLGICALTDTRRAPSDVPTWIPTWHLGGSSSRFDSFLFLCSLFFLSFFGCVFKDFVVGQRRPLPAVDYVVVVCPDCC